MEYIEKTHSCSGVGFTVPYYVFYNFNNSPATIKGVNNDCLPFIQDTIRSWFKIAYITSYVVFAFLLINVILSLFVCFSKRHNHQGDVYARMNYYDD